MWVSGRSKILETQHWFLPLFYSFPWPWYIRNITISPELAFHRKFSTSSPNPSAAQIVLFEILPPSTWKAKGGHSASSLGILVKESDASLTTQLQSCLKWNIPAGFIPSLPGPSVPGPFQLMLFLVWVQLALSAWDGASPSASENAFSQSPPKRIFPPRLMVLYLRYNHEYQQFLKKGD